MYIYQETDDAPDTRPPPRLMTDDGNMSDSYLGTYLSTLTCMAYG